MDNNDDNENQNEDSNNNEDSNVQRNLDTSFQQTSSVASTNLPVDF